jgi:hypothetical protein
MRPDFLKRKMRPNFLKRTPTTLASQYRSRFFDQEWQGIRKKVLIQITIGGLAFLLWFLICLCYVYGSLYQNNGRHHNLHILAVDYDGGAIGQALQAAYSQLKGKDFITLEFHPPNDYPTESDVYQAVWHGHYWGSIAVAANASERLSAALQGGEAATSYQPTSALYYVWNEQLYPAYADSVVNAQLSRLVAGTRLAYYKKMDGAEVSRIVTNNGEDPAALEVLLDPIQAVVANVHPASFGTANLMNTVSMVMPVLMAFFFIMVLNGVLGAHNLYLKMAVFSSMRLRRIMAIVYTCFAGLIQTSYFWAFREDWGVGFTEFILTWLVFWFVVHTHLVILETIVTLVPLPVMPFVVLSWILMNVASTISPLELQPGFYHWGIALPAHNSYSVLVTIWTKGAHNKLYRALPILCSWWLLGNITTTLSHIRACHLAYKYDHEHSDGSQKTKEKDTEAGATNSEESVTISRSSTIMSTQRTHEETARETAREHREVYGPSIPPFVYGA